MDLSDAAEKIPSDTTRDRSRDLPTSSAGPDIICIYGKIRENIFFSGYIREQGKLNTSVTLFRTPMSVSWNCQSKRELYKEEWRLSRIYRGLRSLIMQESLCIVRKQFTISCHRSFESGYSTNKLTILTPARCSFIIYNWTNCCTILILELHIITYDLLLHISTLMCHLLWAFPAWIKLYTLLILIFKDQDI